MEILLDQQLNGMKKFLESYGYTVHTALEINMATAIDDLLIKEAKEHNYLFITKNNDAADFARMHDVKLIHINMVFEAKAVHNEIQSWET